MAQRRKLAPEPESYVQHEDPARATAEATAAATFGDAKAASAMHHEAAEQQSASQGGNKRAVAQYDYEKAEENELQLREGETITNIDMVDDDWWMGRNSSGDTGLFPSNYVELVEDGADNAHESTETGNYHADESEAPAAPPVASASNAGKTATALYDYEAAEDNELSFPDGATITAVVSVCMSCLHPHPTRHNDRPSSHVRSSLFACSHHRRLYFPS